MEVNRYRYIFMYDILASDHECYKILSYLQAIKLWKHLIFVNQIDEWQVDKKSSQVDWKSWQVDKRVWHADRKIWQVDKKLWKVDRKIEKKS